MNSMKIQETIMLVKSSLPAAVRASKTPMLKLPINLPVGDAVPLGFLRLLCQFF